MFTPVLIGRYERAAVPPLFSYGAMGRSLDLVAEIERYAGSSQMMFNWDEADHPRAPAGSSDGGQFVKKEEASEPVAASMLTDREMQEAKQRYPEWLAEHAASKPSPARAKAMARFEELNKPEPKKVTGPPVLHEATGPDGMTAKVTPHIFGYQVQAYQPNGEKMGAPTVVKYGENAKDKAKAKAEEVVQPDYYRSEQQKAERELAQNAANVAEDPRKAKSRDIHRAVSYQSALLSHYRRKHERGEMSKERLSNWEQGINDEIEWYHSILRERGDMALGRDGYSDERKIALQDKIKDLLGDNSGRVSKFAFLADLHLPYDDHELTVDRYEWVESQHPRHEAGSSGGVGGQFKGRDESAASASVQQKPPQPYVDARRFSPVYDAARAQEDAAEREKWSKFSAAPGLAKSTKRRDVAEPPNLPREHPLHWSNAGEYSQQIYDWHFAIHREMKEITSYFTAGAGANFDDAWERAWQIGDKSKVRALLDQMNQLDKQARAKGINLSEFVNANGLIPNKLAERLSSGSRFFDPERLRDQIKEGNKQAGIKPKPPEPRADYGPPIFTGNKRPGAGPAFQAKPAPAKEPEPVQPPAEQSTHESMASAITSAFDSLSSQGKKKVDAAIRAIGDEQGGMTEEHVKQLRDTVMDVWQTMKQDAEDYNQALQEVMGNVYKSLGVGANSLAQRLARGMDYDQVKGFDQVAQFAANHYPQLLSRTSGESDSKGDNESLLKQAIIEGKREVPQPWSPEVIQSVADQFRVAMASAAHPIEVDDSVPFSIHSMAVEIMRYMQQATSANIDQYQWRESDHPRGQPGNAGQFVERSQMYHKDNSHLPTKVRLFRAADDDFMNSDSTSFSRSEDAAREYLNNPGFGGGTLYKTRVEIDPSTVMDLYDSADPIAEIMEATGLPNPGAIGADEWIPRIASKLADIGVSWVRVKESFPEDTETWIHIGGVSDDPELTEIE